MVITSLFFDKSTNTSSLVVVILAMLISFIIKGVRKLTQYIAANRKMQKQELKDFVKSLVVTAKNTEFYEISDIENWKGIMIDKINEESIQTFNDIEKQVDLLIEFKKK